MTDWTQSLVAPASPILDAVAVINASSLQVALVVTEDRKLLGTVTDGDVRRGLLKRVALEDPVNRIMNAHPTTASPTDTRQQVLAVMRQRKINQIPVVDAHGRVAGLYLLNDLIQPTQRDNWVVLQAGGLGSRLKPLTDGCPKPMLQIGSRPLLESILVNFIEQGFNRFFISVNYKAEMVQRYFADGSKWGAQIEYLREDEQLGTAGALSLLPETPTLPMVVMNGDLLTLVNFNQMLDFHNEQSATATMGVREYDFQVPFGVVKLDEQRLVALEEKPVQRYFINAGVYVLEPSTLSLIHPGQRTDMTTVFRQLMDNNAETAVFPIREYWLDIGRYDDLERANREFNQVFAA